ncbi:hypothetical protein M513_12025 [Trichuris suis]|uniref:DUF4371 domain-containing protein n=1 Tax=Trichuris suis TaxID=68888 RepID=A0A085LQ69_9BILA|nr:hypothetical protein M513_12025 [Trichuris suis]
MPGNEAVLLAYVRFIRGEEHFVEELKNSKELETDTRGESIFQVVQEFFSEKGIPLQNIIAVATDGAPAMVRCHRRFISRLKKIVLNVLSIHCVLHRQHFVARRLSTRLNESLQYVISAVALTVPVARPPDSKVSGTFSARTREPAYRLMFFFKAVAVTRQYLLFRL